MIGLYTADGSGMLFTDSFYWSLYGMIVKIRGEEEVTSMYLPFIFV